MREVPAAESQKVPWLSGRKVSPVVWEKAEADVWQGHRVSPHLPPDPLGETFRTPEFKELTNLVGASGLGVCWPGVRTGWQ